jgi:pseudouridylate synthase
VLAHNATVRIHPEVAEALASGRAVVALESTIISHGLPYPQNLQVARQLEADVRAAGAVPATIAVVDGVPRIGLDDA